MKIYNFFESEMQVANVPKLVQVPNYTHESKMFKYADEFVMEFLKGQKNMIPSTLQIERASPQDYVQSIYLYVFRNTLLAVKINKLNNNFVHYSNLCEIFDCADIDIVFGNKNNDVTTTGKILQELWKMKNGEESSNPLDVTIRSALPQEPIELGKKYHHDVIEIIKICVDKSNELISFYPIITDKGEKLFDNLIQARAEIVNLHRQQREAKKFTNYPFTIDQIII